MRFKIENRIWFPGILILLFSLVYAVLRYHIFKGVAWEHLPLYTLNKVLSLAGLTLLVFHGIRQLRQGTSGNAPDPFPAYLGMVCIFFHVLFSMILISPKIYDDLFLADGKFSWEGELSMFFGVLGLFFRRRSQ